jgi:UDP-N-acetylmuramoyl-L-alanyl-D-glutamate--2,6-diaminopimelate ligase
LKNLKYILEGLAYKQVIGDIEVDFNEINFDSRLVSKGDLFVALNGVELDGHRFIDAAINKGALIIVCEVIPEISSGITYVLVEDSALALSLLAANFYDRPSFKLKVIGITGTNGKTTIASQLFELANSLGYTAGLLSTIAIRIGADVYPATHTTPDSIQINRYMDLMWSNGVEYCFMEVSSHGIDQQRIAGINFTGAVFTNLTHDHLDYHKTFSEYRDVKKRLFDSLPKNAFALVNSDDKNGLFMLQNSRANKRTYAFKGVADYQGKMLENSLSGLHFRINKEEIYAKMLGVFNAYNLTALYGVSQELGWDKTNVLTALSLLEGAQGRFQYEISKSGIYVIVDYAHTPDALKNVLSTIRDFNGLGKVLTVVGCGGDRDKAKRPKMAEIAALLSDFLILTSDNPRSEDPDQILRDMEEGLTSENRSKTISVSNRYQALKLACQQANANDVVLVAGKGHETYQEIRGVRHDFDDRSVVNEILIELKK